MNKSDLVTAVIRATGLARNDAESAVEATFGAITHALKTGDEVRLVGFGSFSVTERAASEGRNPRTGEKILIKASKQPKFSVGKALKEAVNTPA